MGTAAGGDPIFMGPCERGNEGDNNYDGYGKSSITLVLTD
jgi:hypothetical protein